MATKKKKKRGKRGKITLGPTVYPRSIEREYYRDLKYIVKELREIIPTIIQRLRDEDAEAQRVDAKSETRAKARNATAVTRSLSGVKTQIDTVVKRARPRLIAQGVGRKAVNYALGAINTQFRGVMTLNPTDISSAKETAEFVAENVALIKSIKEQFHERVIKTVEEMWGNGSSTKDIQSKLFEDNDITLRRARLIARDQIGKLNSEITEKRHKELGVTEYYWSCALDERVRGNPAGLYPDAKYSHWDREGKVFKYSEPPEDGHAGTPINCRCVRIPKLPEELD